MKKQVILAIGLLLGGFTQLEAANFIGYVNKADVLDTIKVKKDAFYKKGKTGNVKATYFAAFIDSAKYIGFVDFYTNGIPDTIVEIRAKAFENCTTVSAICIPASVTSLDCSAFDGCNLDSLFSMNAIPPTLTGSLPTGLQKIKVPGDYVAAYKAADGWKDCNIVAIPKVNKTDDYVLLSYRNVTTYEDVKFNFHTVTTVVDNAHFFCKLTLKDLYLFDDDSKVDSILAAELQLFKDYPTTLTKNIHIVRTFNENGTRHTLCLPFGVTKAQFNASALGDGKTVTIQTFTGATVTNPGEPNEALEITVEDVDVSALGDNDTLLYAGKPYILTWANTGGTIYFPVFNDVKLNLSAPITPAEWTNNVKMQGVFWLTGMTEKDYSTLFISPDGTFSWPSKTNNMRGFRAYFLVNTSSSSPIRKGMCVRLNEVSGRSVTTEMEQAQNESQKATCTKIMRNGQLIIVRDNVEYTIMGGQIQ